MGIETVIETEVCRYARTKGFKTLKLHGGGAVGKPDRVFIGPQMRLCFVEFKAPGEMPRKTQLRWRDFLVACGFKHAFVNTVTGGKRLVDTLAVS